MTHSHIQKVSLDWHVVDLILEQYTIAWGDRSTNAREHLAAVHALEAFKASHPDEYTLARRWFDSPNVRNAVDRR